MDTEHFESAMDLWGRMIAEPAFAHFFERGLRHFAFAVGMRLHFLIFSALQEVPFVALPYASKIVGFLEELGIQTPPIDLVNAGRLIAHIDYYWDKQEELKSLIRTKLPALKERAMHTNKLLLNLLTYADIDATR